MKNYLILLSIILLASCQPKIVEEVVVTAYDSTIVKSEKLHDSILVYIPKVDRKIEKLQEKILYKVIELRKQNESLKKEASITKTITIRDTVYIKEKTNFWGKKKVTTDSIHSKDSTENENN